MEWHYCWRCKDHVPMFNEKEWELLRPAFGWSLRDICKWIDSFNIKPQHNIYFHKVARIHKQLSGVVLSDMSAVWHHRLASFGHSCTTCGYLLRTPKTKKCFHCGQSLDGTDKMADFHLQE